MYKNELQILITTKDYGPLFKLLSRIFCPMILPPQDAVRFKKLEKISKTLFEKLKHIIASWYHWNQLDKESSIATKKCDEDNKSWGEPIDLSG